MWRVLAEPVAFFLAPFVLYVFYLLALRRHPLQPTHWPSGAVVGLTIMGLVVAVGGMLFFGLTADREKGAYTPAHVENGKLVPGHFK
jgi:hypothetical protein